MVRFTIRATFLIAAGAGCSLASALFQEARGEHTLMQGEPQQVAHSGPIRVLVYVKIT